MCGILQGANESDRNANRQLVPQIAY